VARGIGAAIAALCSREGAIPVIVDVVAPAEVLTPQYRSWWNKFPDPNEAEREITSGIPLDDRSISPNEIASAVFFLLSPGGKMNGQEVCVDGGYVHPEQGLASRQTLSRPFISGTGGFM
jgi:Enoyl-(Acyl carrier protein) reductase